MKTLSLMSIQYLCGAMLALSSMHLTATESDLETTPVFTETNETKPVAVEAPEGTKVSSEESEILAPAGTRALTANEYLAIKKRLYQENKQKSASDETPKADVLKNLLKTESAQFKGGQAKLNYVTTNPGVYHFMYAVGLYYETLTTEDGTVWNICPSDSYKLSNWLTTDTIVVMPNHAWFSSYGYCLVNLDTNTSVEATVGLYVKPAFHSVFNHRVALIDDLRRMIWLEDGSVWTILGNDYNLLHWQIGDTVIMGVNDGWYMNSYPNILINAVNLVGARAVCIHY